MKEKIKLFLKRNYYYFILILFIYVFFFIKFPYYIDAPGGIVDINDRIEIENKTKTAGTFNLAFVSEYEASLFTMLIALFNDDWKIIKEEEIVLENESNSDYESRDKLLMEESVSNAIYVAYNNANKDINVKDKSVTIAYIYDSSKNDLEVGDIILEVNGIKVSTKEDIKNILKGKKEGDLVELKVKNEKSIKNRQVHLIEYEGEIILGVIICNINEYETTPKIKINIDKRESGPSGGLMMSLAIYNSITDEDITKGRIIVGTGTIDLSGNVGEISGVEYKLKSAVKENADIFLVPNGDNYQEAIKIKKENDYDIEVVGVDKFIDALNYLTK